MGGCGKHLRRRLGRRWREYGWLKCRWRATPGGGSVDGAEHRWLAAGCVGVDELSQLDSAGGLIPRLFSALIHGRLHALGGALAPAPAHRFRPAWSVVQTTCDHEWTGPLFPCRSGPVRRGQSPPPPNPPDTRLRDSLPRCSAVRGRSTQPLRPLAPSSRPAE